MSNLVIIQNSIFIVLLLLTCNTCFLLRHSTNTTDNLDHNQRISLDKYEITADPLVRKCDIYYKQTITVSFKSKSSIIKHVIISKKNPLIDFEINLIEATPADPADGKQITVLRNDISRDNNFKQQIYTENGHNYIKYRSRWVILTYLSSQITTAVIDYEYISKRSMLIDNDKHLNIFKFALYNPYNSELQLSIMINLLNFSKLTLTNFNRPYNSTANYSEKLDGINNIEVVMQRKLTFDSQYEFKLDIPLEISTCDPTFSFLIFYGLLGMTVAFVIISLVAILSIMKE